MQDHPAMDSPKRVVELLGEVKRLAREYYELTGKPLGITGEIAEYEAERRLGVELAPARQAGYDAIRKRNGREELVQIKGRRLTASPKPGQRLGAIGLEKRWDVVLLVLLDEHFEPTAIYEANRPALEKALSAPGSRARNERGQLSVSKFKAIARQVWPA
jgi:hypothetical protein